ncbi:MAG TPA: thioredoxin domain-containing protein, partial [Isosphaeraceae bacterium]|nr:thioredoxin domain-containing protein [Isosphaeraceae bacterium]
LRRDEAELRAELAEDRTRLLEVRSRRVPPGKDTKVLTSWNGLMLAPLAEATPTLGDERYVAAARKAAGFLLDRMRTPDGRLLHSYKDEQARFNGYLDDYACLIDGLTRLFEVTGEPRWVEAALSLAGVMLDEFADPDGGGFFYTGRSHEALIARQKDAYDNATPSGNAMAATALLRLGAITGRDRLLSAGRETLQALHLLLEQSPRAAGQSLIALDFLLGSRREFAIIAGQDEQEFRRTLSALYARFLPHKVVSVVPPGQPPAIGELVPLLADRPAVSGRTTTYICEHYTCQAPVVGVEGLEDALKPE